MSLNFRTIAIAASVICFVLAGTWLLAPSLLLEMWGIQYSYPVGLMARRAAALFLGFGVMFVLARDAQPSHTHTHCTNYRFVRCLPCSGSARRLRVRYRACRARHLVRRGRRGRPCHFVSSVNAERIAPCKRAGLTLHSRGLPPATAHFQR